MRRNLLVVDDSPGMRQLLGNTLREAGYSVYEAEDGEHALSVLDQLESVDGIVTDLCMPNVDGLGLLRTLRSTERFRRTPVIVLTVEQGEDRQRDLTEAGCDAWMAKPFLKKDLLATVGRLMP